MNFFRVRNWEKFQHYHQRNPPWIKLYQDLLRQIQWQALSDTERSHLIGIFLLASHHDNRVPCDQHWLKHELCTYAPIHLNRFVELGWIEDANTTVLASSTASTYASICASISLASCLQDASLEKRRVETETETENPPTVPLLAKPVPKPKYSTEFEFFWEHCTKRGSKLAAYKAWTKIPDLTQVSTQILTAMDSWMQESSQWKDETKQPHIATWLNRRGWEELIPKNGATRGESRYKTKSELTEEACARVLDKLNQKNRS